MKKWSSLNRMLSTFVFGQNGMEIQDVNGKAFPKSQIVDMLEDSTLTVSGVDTFVLSQRVIVNVSVDDILIIMSSGNGYISSFDFDYNGLNQIEFRIIDGATKYWVSVKVK